MYTLFFSWVGQALDVYILFFSDMSFSFGGKEFSLGGTLSDGDYPTFLIGGRGWPPPSPFTPTSAPPLPPVAPPLPPPSPSPAHALPCTHCVSWEQKLIAANEITLRTITHALEAHMTALTKSITFAHRVSLKSAGKLTARLENKLLKPPPTVDMSILSSDSDGSSDEMPMNNPGVGGKSQDGKEDIITRAVMDPDDTFAILIWLLFRHGINTEDGIVFLRCVFYDQAHYVVVSTPTVSHALRCIHMDVSAKQLYHRLKDISVRDPWEIPKSQRTILENEYFGLQPMATNFFFAVSSRFVVLRLRHLMHAAKLVHLHKPHIINLLVGADVAFQTNTCPPRCRTPFLRTYEPKRLFNRGWSLVDDHQDLQSIRLHLAQIYAFGSEHGMFTAEEQECINQWDTSQIVITNHMGLPVRHPRPKSFF